MRVAMLLRVLKVPFSSFSSGSTRMSTWSRVRSSMPNLPATAFGMMMPQELPILLAMT